MIDAGWVAAPDSVSQGGDVQSCIDHPAGYMNARTPSALVADFHGCGVGVGGATVAGEGVADGAALGIALAEASDIAAP
jgi:hypothetical protein